MRHNVELLQIGTNMAGQLACGTRSSLTVNGVTRKWRTRAISKERYWALAKMIHELTRQGRVTVKPGLLFIGFYVERT